MASTYQVQNIVWFYIAMIIIFQMNAQSAVAASHAPKAAPTLSASAPVTATPEVTPASPPKKSLSSAPIGAPVGGPMKALISTSVSAPAPGPLANEKSAGVMTVTTFGWKTLVLASGVLVAAAAL